MQTESFSGLDTRMETLALQQPLTTPTYFRWAPGTPMLGVRLDLKKLFLVLLLLYQVQGHDMLR